MGIEHLRHPEPGVALAVAPQHCVHFYEEDDALVERLISFAGSALRAGNSSIVGVTAKHRELLLERLPASGIVLDEVIKDGRLTFVDTSEALKQISPDGELNHAYFHELVDALLTSAESAAGDSNQPVAVCGEMAGLLWLEGRPEAAIQLEQMWNEAATRRPFSLLCAYRLRGFDLTENAAAVRRICAEHSEIMPTESYAAVESEADRLIEFSRLRQKVREWDEVAAERDRLAAELAEESRELGRLRELSLRAGRDEVPNVLRETLAAAMQVQKADFGLLLLCNEEDGELRRGASVGFDEEGLAPIPILSEGSGASGVCMSRGKRVIVDDTELDPIFAGLRSAARRSGFRAVNSTPLVAHSKELLGVLSVYFRQPFRPSAREMRWTEMYAQVASDAIENAGLLRELQTEQAMRRITERALSESEEFSRIILEHCDDYIKVLDAEGRLVYMSPAGQRALEIDDLSSILGEYWPDFWEGGDRERALEAIEEARRKNVGRFQGSRMVGERVTHWDVTIAPMLDGRRLEAGEAAERLLVISREITEVRRETQQLK